MMLKSKRMPTSRNSNRCPVSHTHADLLLGRIDMPTTRKLYTRSDMPNCQAGSEPNTTAIVIITQSRQREHDKQTPHTLNTHYYVQTWMRAVKQHVHKQSSLIELVYKTKISELAVNIAHVGAQLVIIMIACSTLALQLLIMVLDMFWGLQNSAIQSVPHGSLILRRHCGRCFRRLVQRVST